ncbi:unnamed protein product, partial [Ectocarpus sp. 12 AP-2014]
WKGVLTAKQLEEHTSLTISSSLLCWRLRFLELNSWMWEVNGINILVDPVFGTVDFGVPLLVQANKQVLSDGERAMRELAAVTDFLVISQGFDDHCHRELI